MTASVHSIQKPNVTMLFSIPAVKQGVATVPEDELRVGTLGQDVQQICRSHKVEAGKSHTLGLQGQLDIAQHLDKQGQVVCLKSLSDRVLYSHLDIVSVLVGREGQAQRRPGFIDLFQGFLNDQLLLGTDMCTKRQRKQWAWLLKFAAEQAEGMAQQGRQQVLLPEHGVNPCQLSLTCSNLSSAPGTLNGAFCWKNLRKSSTFSPKESLLRRMSMASACWSGARISRLRVSRQSAPSTCQWQEHVMAETNSRRHSVLLSDYLLNIAAALA
ncbi:MAG: hypothetical protein FRX49_10880 [Trebouxia sp. A1-2]|nr:MAG: hypothetical protein FRX49_10880 [Trebouxia sp. A1-2]